MQVEENKRKQMLTSNYRFWPGLSCNVTKIFNSLNKSQPKEPPKYQFLIKVI